MIIKLQIINFKVQLSWQITKHGSPGKLEITNNKAQPSWQIENHKIHRCNINITAPNMPVEGSIERDDDGDVQDRHQDDDIPDLRTTKSFLMVYHKQMKWR